MQPFSLYLPTRLIYGKDRIEELDDLTRNYGTRVLLVAGTGSARKSGLVDRVKAALVGREIVELEGVVPNPRIDSVRAGAALCKEHGVDFIVAVGGGSVIDCSKAIAAAAVSDGSQIDATGASRSFAMPSFSEVAVLEITALLSYSLPVAASVNTVKSGNAFSMRSG